MSDVFQFDITGQQFMLLNHAPRMPVEMIREILFQPITCHWMTCSLVVKHQRINGPNSKVACSINSSCNQSGCYKFKIQIYKPLPNEVNAKVVCTRTGNLCHTMLKSEHIRGTERRNVGNALKQTSSSIVFMERIPSCQGIPLATGNLKKSVRYNVLHKISSQINAANDFAVNDLQDIMLQKLNEGNDDEFIRFVDAPLNVAFFLDAQISILKQDATFSRPLVAHFDSTGGVVRKIQGATGQNPYYYCLVVNSEGSFLPLCEFILSRQNAHTITHSLNIWKRKCVELNVAWPPVNIVVVDFSYALIQSVSQSMNDLHLLSYLEAVYSVIISKEMNSSLVIIKMCVSHLIKGWKLYMKNCSFVFVTGKSQKSVKDMALKIICNLILEETMDSFSKNLSNICKVFLQKFDSSEIKKIVNGLLIRKHSDPEMLVEFDPQNGNTINVRSKTLREQSPFYKALKPQWILERHIADELNVASVEKPKNVLFCPQLLTYIMNVYVPIAPLWSGLEYKLFNSQSTTFSNANVEGFIRQTKSYLGRKTDKCGRVILKLKNRNKRIVNSVKFGIGPLLKKRKKPETVPTYIPMKNYRMFSKSVPLPVQKQDQLEKSCTKSMSVSKLGITKINPIYRKKQTIAKKSATTVKPNTTESIDESNMLSCCKLGVSIFNPVASNTSV